MGLKCEFTHDTDCIEKKITMISSSIYEIYPPKQERKKQALMKQMSEHLKPKPSHTIQKVMPVMASRT
ncbi:hypothetical protein CHS0354_006301 [Potamilus streckersoni]|uniref:Uncharacterized protein n=1 Tax=Potamilus streckersoni TaxID=2493646 RepID=A0AAE0VNZ3_9BIVA|nr:hypothetical protein CHS0354_006301 [Potamilus streckersoni]